VEPNNGAHIKPDATTPFTVSFDTEMKMESADTVISVQGCNAKIVDPRWANNTTLTFKVKVPAKPSSQSAQLIVRANAAKASGGFPSELDGNTTPPGQSGQAPSGDDYTWKVLCGTALDLFLSGPAGGQTLDGQVGGAGAQLACNASGGSDQVITVHWSGELPNGTQVAGQFDLKPGSWTFGPGGSAQGTVTLDLLRPSNLHAAGASGGPFGTGAGTVTTGASGGSINATLDSGVMVRGTWQC
jgi:hypothetical protein